MLIVNDDPPPEILTGLENEYRCVASCDGKAGLERALDLKPDLIVSELITGDLTGDIVVKTVRTRPDMRDTPIVMLGDNADDDLPFELLKDGVQNYLRKPVAIEDLRACIGDLIELQRARAVLQADLQTPERDVVTLAREVTLQKRRLAFLAHASKVLTGSLEYDEMVRCAAVLMVPDLADFCTIELVGEQGRILKRAVVHSDPEREEKLREVHERFSLEPGGGSPLTTAWTGGASELIAVLDSKTLDDHPQREALSAMIDELGLRSYMAIPLIARGRTTGVMGLGSRSASRTYGQDDLTQAEMCASRAALAIDNAQIYHESREAIRLRDEFLSVASHELRTPLTPLQLHVDGLNHAARKNALTPERLTSGLGSASRMTHSLARLVDNLLDLSRVNIGQLVLQPEEVELEALAYEVVERFVLEAQHAGSELRFQCRRPVAGRWDRVRIEQVLSNLISNGIKYGHGGPIDITIDSAEGTAMLTVADQGIGIAAADMVRIFDRFERAVSVRRYGGLGLGLYISREIVEAHGGGIVVESCEGAGSRFMVLLPLESKDSPT